MMLANYRGLLLKWNARVNLTGATTTDLVDEHIADCLHVVDHLPERGRIIDVGSGGGLPSVVIAISRPELVVTALEPVHKKHAFLRTAVRELGLRNLIPLAERWEDHASRDYDVATSRATFDVDRWLQIGAQLIRPGGFVLAMEGKDLLDPLPDGVSRHAYSLGSKTRAILIRS